MMMIQNWGKSIKTLKRSNRWSTPRRSGERKAIWLWENSSLNICRTLNKLLLIRSTANSMSLRTEWTKLIRTWPILSGKLKRRSKKSTTASRSGPKKPTKSWSKPTCCWSARKKRIKLLTRTSELGKRPWSSKSNCSWSGTTWNGNKLKVKFNTICISWRAWMALTTSHTIWMSWPKPSTSKRMKEKSTTWASSPWSTMSARRCTRNLNEAQSSGFLNILLSIFKF